jgi:hypothetical protein
MEQIARFLYGSRVCCPSEMMNLMFGLLAGKLGPFSRKLCSLPGRVRLAMPLSSPSISPGRGLPGADLSHIGAKYNLDFLLGKLKNPPLGLP